ncbi:MAG TPA: hypothetical protein VF337_03630 [Candidatus Limnocylindrales bacterium]
MMLSIGGGQFISTSAGPTGALVNIGQVGQTTIDLVEHSSGAYLGWANADTT